MNPILLLSVLLYGALVAPRPRKAGTPIARMPRSLSRIFHVPHGTAYHIENSSVGLARAVLNRFRIIDWDLNITRDGIVVVCHWPIFSKDGFAWQVVKAGTPGAKQLPSGEWIRRHNYGRNVRIADLPWSEVQKLRTHDGFRIWTIGQGLVRAKAAGVMVAMEEKGDRRFEDVTVQQSIARSVHRAGMTGRVLVMTLQNLGNPSARLKAAKEAGFITVLQARGHEPTWARTATWIDYRRGAWK